MQENLSEMAKAALLFYREAQDAGANEAEAARLTQVFMASLSMRASQIAEGKP